MPDDEITRKGQTGKHSVKLEVYLKDGHCLKRQLPKAKSVSSIEIVDKFKLLTEKIIDKDRAEKIYKYIMELEKLRDISILTEAIS